MYHEIQRDLFISIIVRNVFFLKELEKVILPSVHIEAKESDSVIGSNVIIREFREDVI
jgi:hypothetical protein